MPSVRPFKLNVPTQLCGQTSQYIAAGCARAYLLLLRTYIWITSVDENSAARLFSSAATKSLMGS